MSPSNRYTTQEIRDILEACRDTGVASLKMGTFAVSFLAAQPQASEPAAPPTPEQVDALKTAEDEAMSDLEERLKADYLANLRLSDPEQYEELINREELTDAGAGPETTLPG